MAKQSLRHQRHVHVKLGQQKGLARHRSGDEVSLISHAEAVLVGIVKVKASVSIRFKCPQT